MRQAMSKAINRDAIVARVMEGEAIPAGQLLPDGYFGVSPKLKPEAYDPEGAKKLLAEAGFPNGFKLTLHTPNGRYINDDKIAQAVAQMLTRVGIETTVEALPPAVFFTRASQGGPKASPSSASSWSAGRTPTGENSGSLVPLANTFDKSKGMGTANRGRYSNPEVDRLLAPRRSGPTTMPSAQRCCRRRPRSPSRTWRSSPRTTRSTPGRRAKGCKYKARTDEYTLATHLVQAEVDALQPSWAEAGCR